MFLGRKSGRTVFYLPILFVVGLLFFLRIEESLSQNSDQNQPLRIIIGELSGRTDPRDLTLLTSQGSYPVLGSGNSKPFELVNQTPALIELKYNATRLRPDNPQKFVYKFYQSERDLLSALILEEVDFAELENEESAQEVQDSNAHFRPFPQIRAENIVKLVCYNHGNPILKSKRVRTALSYAIDHGRIKRDILGGKADIATGPFENRSPLFNSRMNSYRHDPRRAIDLLEREGWTDSDRDGLLDKDGQPFQIELIYQKGLTIDEAISRQILINLLKLKIEIKPRPLTKSAINDRLSSGDFEAILMDYTFENSFESLEEFFSRNGAMNYMGYRSTAIEQYGAMFKKTKDQGDQKSIIKSIQNVINSDQPVTFLYFKWVTHYLINVHKFDNFRDTSEKRTGELRPFEQWRFKNLDKK